MRPYAHIVQLQDIVLYRTGFVEKVKSTMENPAVRSVLANTSVHRVGDNRQCTMSVLSVSGRGIARPRAVCT